MNSVMDFSSILQAANRPDPLMGGLGPLGGVSDMFATNPFMFSPETNLFAQQGMLGGQLDPFMSSGPSMFGNSAQNVLTTLLMTLLSSQNSQVNQYPTISKTVVESSVESKPETTTEAVTENTATETVENKPTTAEKIKAVVDNSPHKKVAEKAKENHPINKIKKLF